MSKHPVGREHIECDVPGCSKPGPSKRCSRCYRTFYCNVACQRAHWKTCHKQECFDVNVLREQISTIGKKNPVSEGDSDSPDSVQEMSICKTTHEIEQDKSEDKCCFICLSETLVDPYTIPKCGHSFCFTCLHYWQGVAGKSTWKSDSASQTKNRTCPICRAEAPDLSKEVHETALMYEERASRRDRSKEERRKDSDSALAELTKIDTEETNDPSEKAMMLFTKSDILLQLDRPGEAFQALKEIEAMDRKGEKDAAKTKVLLDSLDAAAAESQTEEIGRITQQLEELKKNSINTIQLPNSGFDLYIKIAKCYEAMKDYEEAIGIYNKITSAIDYDDPNPDAETPSQQRMLLMNMSRCFYHSGDYEYAIQLGKGAIEMNRHFPQVHKYVALSQKASGDLKGAVRTMGRAAMYETPWDDVNQKFVLEMYEELQREYSALSSSSNETANAKEGDVNTV